MPKIPTFTTQARPTAEVGSTTATVSVPLTQTIGTALTPVTDAVAKHRVQEKNFENKTEALKLENEALLEFTDTLERASRLDNKDQAFEIVKTESERIKNTFSNKASNKYVQTLFNNNFYGEVQKGIFKVNNRVSTNILESLDNEVNVKKNRLLTDAYLSDNEMAFQLVGSELESLYESNFKGRIDLDDYNKLIQNIPAELQVFQATQQISKNPRQAYLNLKDSNQFTDMDLKTRTSLINEAKGYIVPELREQWKNFTAAAAYGVEEDFDMEFAKEILPSKEVNSMLKNYDTILTTVDNVKMINSMPSSELSDFVTNTIDESKKTKTFTDWFAEEKLLKEAVAKRQKAMSEDPAGFLIASNDNIKDLAQDFDQETNLELKSKKKTTLVNAIVETQIEMGQPPYDIKVMSGVEANQFITEYMNLDGQGRVALLQKLDLEFGQYNGNAMLQLANAGLPVSAQLSSFFANPSLTEKFLSFDSEEKQKSLKDWGDRNNIKFEDVRKNITNELKDFEDIAVLGSRFNSSVASDKMQDIVDVLSYYAMNEMFAGRVSQGKAESSAASLINDSFVLEDTFFVPKIYNGVDISSTIEEETGIVDKANIIKDFYLETFNPVAFGSANELGSEEDIILNDAMKDQMKNFGEWRNTADGTGLIFGIVFNDGSFGPIKNSNGDYLQFNFDDTSLLIPGTETEYDPEIRTKTQLLQPRRAYPYVPESVQKKQENEGTIIRSGSRTQRNQ